MKSIVFVGSKKSGLKALEEISRAHPVSAIISIDDQTDQRSAYSEFRDKGAVFVADKAASIAAIKDAAPDFVFVHGWYWLLPKEITDRCPVIGVHNSLLPKYRGGAPLVWAMINGEAEVGSSIFRIAEGMDDGEVYAQVRVAVGGDDHIGDVLPRLDDAVLRELPAIWRGIIDGSVSGQQQCHDAATFCSQRHPDDGLINWNKSAMEIHNFIRAQAAPYPRAYSMDGHDRVYIDRSTPFPFPYAGTPGQVVQKKAGKFIVACGDGNAVLVESSGLTTGMRLG